MGRVIPLPVSEEAKFRLELMHAIEDMNRIDAELEKLLDELDTMKKDLEKL